MGPSKRFRQPWKSAIRVAVASYALALAAPAPAADALAPSSQSQIGAEFAMAIVPLTEQSTGRAFLNVSVPQDPVSASPISIQGQILSTHELGRVDLSFTVLDASSRTVDTQMLSLTPLEGATPFRFDWFVSEAPDADYRLVLDLTDPSGKAIAWAEWTAVKRSRPTVEALQERAQAALNAFDAFAESQNAHDPGPRIGWTKIAQDSLAAGDLQTPAALLRTDANARFALAAVDRARAAIAFRPRALPSQTPSEPLAPRPDRRSGGFHHQGQPLFLAGLAAQPGAPARQRSQKYGFNLIGLHADLSASTTDSASPLAGRLAKIEADGLAAAVWLDNAEFDEPVPGPVLRGLAAPNVAAVSLATQPRIAVGGADVRSSFIEFVKNAYKDRFEVNRAWKRHLLAYDEIDIWPGYDNPAYQFDWQTYKRRLVTRRILEYADTWLARAPDLPLTITMTGDIVQPSETRYGLDQELLSKSFPVASVRTEAPFDDPVYGQSFPHAQFVFTLRRSFAPEQPLVALHVLDVAPADRYRRDLAADMRTLAFESAMAGVAAITLELPRMDDPVRDAPEILAALARATGDLQTYASLLAIMREAPAPIAILWSDSSKILDDGRAHLPSVKRAFEGCSFAGHKLRFLTESQLARGEWEGVRVLVIPDTPALSNEAFAALEQFVQGDVAVVRTTQTIAYDERGAAHERPLTFGPDTVLLRGGDDAYEYLEALDEIMARGRLSEIPRTVNASGYPLQGVKTRYIETESGDYLYLVNLRKTPVLCHLTNGISEGRDVITGSHLAFPRMVPPLAPMLLYVGTEDSAASAHDEAEVR